MRLWNNYNNMAVQAKASIWYTICSFFQKGISFIVIPIYVRLLSTDEYGEWSVIQSWASILIVFASLNLYCGVYTKTLIDMPDKKERDRYTSSMQGLGTLTTFVLFLIYLCIREWANKAIGLNTEYMILLFLYFMVYPAFSFWSTRQRVEYKYRSMVVITLAISVLTPFFSIILIECTNLRVEALVLGYLISQCMVGGIFYIIFFVKGHCFYDKNYWNYAFRFNIPLIPHYLSLIILGQSDRIMIKYYCSESDAGIYSFAYQIASAISILIAAINGSRVPWTYEKLKIRRFVELRKTTTILVVMMAGITFMVCMISPEIISILGTADYKEAVSVIPVVTLGLFYTFIYDFYASVEFYFGATKYVMYASVIGAVLNIILNVVFIPIAGFVAAAYTTLVCYMVFMVMHYIFSYKVLKEQKISEEVYDNRAIFLLVIFISAICLASMITFECFIVRVLLIVLIMVCCVVKRKVIKRIFNTIRK